MLARDGLSCPELLTPPIASTDMNEGVVIFGGGSILRQTLEAALAASPKAIFVVTTCPSGVIGDDVELEIERICGIAGKTPVLFVPSDGNLTGDYAQGMINACVESVGSLIDPDETPRENTVNIVAEKNIATNAESSFMHIRSLLDALGLEVNCRFVRSTSVERIRGFKKGRLNLLAYSDHLGRVLRDYLSDNHQAAFAESPFPVGCTQAVTWLREVAAVFGKHELADRVSERFLEDYQSAMARFRPHLEGKKVMLVTYNYDIDWILEPAFDLGMEIVKVCLLKYLSLIHI